MVKGYEHFDLPIILRGLNSVYNQVDRDLLEALVVADHVFWQAHIALLIRKIFEKRVSLSREFCHQVLYFLVHDDLVEA